MEVKRIIKAILISLVITLIVYIYRLSDNKILTTNKAIFSIIGFSVIAWYFLREDENNRI